MTVPSKMKIREYSNQFCGPGSSVSTAPDYGLDGSGSNPVGGEIFCPSRPALGPTQLSTNSHCGR